MKQRSPRLVSEPLVARYWSPAQLMTPVIGTVFVLWGFASLVHSGFHAENVFEPHDSLLGFNYTPLLAAIEVGFGVVMLLAGMLLRRARGRMRTFDGLAVGLGSTVVTLASGAALALGLTVLADGWTDELRHWLGMGRPEAWVGVTVGVVGLLAALASPTVLAPAPQPAAIEPAESELPAPEPSPPTEPTTSSDDTAPDAAAPDAAEPDAADAVKTPEVTDSDTADPGAERREFTVG